MTTATAITTGVVIGAITAVATEEAIRHPEAMKYAAVSTWNLITGKREDNAALKVACKQAKVDRLAKLQAKATAALELANVAMNTPKEVVKK